MKLIILCALLASSVSFAGDELTMKQEVRYCYARSEIYYLAAEYRDKNYTVTETVSILIKEKGITGKAKDIVEEIVVGSFLYPSLSPVKQKQIIKQACLDQVKNKFYKQKVEAAL